MPAAITPVMAAITLAIVATTVQRRIVVLGRALDPPTPYPYGQNRGFS
jgi:hypothetical protein